MNQKQSPLLQGHGAKHLPGHQRGKPHAHQPGVAQPKSTATASQVKAQPVAPPVCCPRPAPKILQTKNAPGRPAQQPGQLPQKPVAPPVYRPEPRKIVQPKMALATRAPKSPKAPSVYRPQPTPKVLQTKTSQTVATTPGRDNRPTPRGQQLPGHEPAGGSQRPHGRAKNHFGPGVASAQGRAAQPAAVQPKLASPPPKPAVIQRTQVRGAYFKRKPEGGNTTAGVIQAKDFFYSKKAGPRGDVMVYQEGPALKLRGTIVINGATQQITGTVKMSEYQIPEDKLKPGGSPHKKVRALRVFGMSASPRGLKLGQILTYHHALIAKEQGIEVIIAMDVSGAGGPFYMPLGFRDFLGNRRWADLNRERNDIDTLVRTGLPPMPPTPSGKTVLDDLLERQGEVVRELSEAKMFISTDDLIANSKRMYEQIWQQEPMKKGG